MKNIGMGSAEEAVRKYQSEEPRGEFVLIVHCEKEENEVSEEEIRALLEECKQKNMTKKDAVAFVCRASSFAQE